MKKEVFVYRSRLEAPQAEVFRWHARPGAFERYVPPWDPVEVVERQGGIEPGARAVVRVRVGPLRWRWVAEHTDYREGELFRDVQREGPFASWDHLHRIEPDGADACVLEDRIEYALPLGPVGRTLAARYTRNQLNRLFAYRHRTLRQDLIAHRSCSRGGTDRILVSGAGGLIGSALIPFLTTGGHEVRRLTRAPQEADRGAVFWDPGRGVLDPSGFEGVDGVVHLAGESIASGRWTAARKARILNSRVQGTRLLCEALAGLDRPPRVLVCASATGYYGSRGEAILSEGSPPGSGFLADVCRDWENATRPAVRRGIRVVHLRFGVVLSPSGGALARMLPPFRLGLGGRIGSGRQFVSWIALDDAIGAVHHALQAESLSGPVNAVAPNPVTNREFTRALAKVLGRPALFPLPAFAARLLLGGMADELLLASARVQPSRLLASGYHFRFPVLQGALAHLLGTEE